MPETVAEHVEDCDVCIDDGVQLTATEVMVDGWGCELDMEPAFPPHPTTAKEAKMPNAIARLRTMFPS